MINFDKILFSEWGKAFASMMIAFVLLMLACVMCGCKTQYVPPERVRTENFRIDSTLFATIQKMMRESVKSNQRSSDSLTHLLKETTTLTENGDTTRHDRIEYIYLSSYKEKEYERIIEELKDSIEMLNTRFESIKSDSIPVPYPVEKQPTKWEKVKNDVNRVAFGILISSMVILLLYLLRVCYIRKNKIIN